jgi:hypothetical protein
VDYGGLTSTYAAAPTGTTANCTSSGVSKAYYTDLGVLASSTKNVYGIYDLSGGLYEYMMSIYSDTTGIPRSGNYCKEHSTIYYFSGFNGTCNNPSDGSETNPATAGINYPDDSKYYNLYHQNSVFTNNSSSTSNRQCTFATCGGQALHEVWTGAGDDGTSSNYRWNSDYASFVYATYPWFIRGGYCYSGTGAGVWSSDNYIGSASSSSGFRPLMSVF